MCVELGHTEARLLDTRKTLPGHRLLEKYATRIGGAINHRSGLDRGWLIKENHLREVGSIEGAIERAKAFGVHGLKVEIEVENLEELDQAVMASPTLCCWTIFLFPKLSRPSRVTGDGSL